MSYYLDDKKLKKYDLLKNTVDNTIILVYYSTSTAELDNIQGGGV